MQNTQIEINGQTYDLSFTWGHFAQLKSALGDDYLDVINTRLFNRDLPDVQTMMTVVSVLTGVKYTDLQDVNLAVINVIKAIAEALTLAMQGPLGADDTDKDAPDNPKLSPPVTRSDSP